MYHRRDLLSEYKELRQYFCVLVLLPYTDMWTNKPDQFYPGKYSCEKTSVICAGSHSVDLVADFFIGSGSAIKAVMASGSCATGAEQKAESFQKIMQYISDNFG